MAADKFRLDLHLTEGELDVVLGRHPLLDVPAGAGYAEKVIVLHGMNQVTVGDMRRLLDRRNEQPPPGADAATLIDLLRASAPDDAPIDDAPPPAAPAAPVPAAGAAAAPAAPPGAVLPAPPGGVAEATWYLTSHAAAFAVFGAAASCPELFLIMPNISACCCFVLYVQSESSALSMKSIKNVSAEIRLFRPWPTMADFPMSHSDLLEECRKLSEGVTALTSGELDALRLNAGLRRITASAGARFFAMIDIAVVAEFKKTLDRFVTSMALKSVDEMVENFQHLPDVRSKMEQVARALVATSLLGLNQCSDFVDLMQSTNCSVVGVTKCLEQYVCTNIMHTTDMAGAANFYAFAEMRLHTYAMNNQVTPTGRGAKGKGKAPKGKKGANNGPYDSPKGKGKAKNKGKKGGKPPAAPAAPAL